MDQRGRSSVLLSYCRTPFGKLGGGLVSFSAIDLGALVIREAITRAAISGADIQHVIMGMVVQAGAGQIPSRQATFKAGLSREVTSDTINRVCASGMRAITMADALIRAGDYDVIVAGGMESMSNAPYLLPNARFGYRMGNGALIDAMQHDGLRCGVGDVVMGQYGDEVAEEEQVGRKEQDAFALRSHKRAVAATDRGVFSEEIVPVEITDRRGMKTRIGRDEAPRPDTSAEALAKLTPVFHPSGTVTAGNAPGVNDGAAAVVVASEAWAAARGIKPLARILTSATAAWDVPYLAYSPAMAASKALVRADLSIDDIDLVEINEAFASVPIISGRRLGVDAERLNVNGGAIALGHPIGASGARLVGSLAMQLRRSGGGLGLAAICSGGAQGDAVIIEVRQ
jgi:acetyl-CoA C-acetyltransferase